jgi:ferredoxin/flavodoxin---NADP+ reductase
MKTWDDLKYSTHTVYKNKELAQGAYVLSFKRNFNFMAGQVVALGITPTIAPRLYSIASGETDEFIEILYSEKLDGSLTPMLSLLKPSDNLMVSEPFGTFTQTSKSAVYIAAGTGIAPFMSRIRSAKAENPTVIHGASYPEFFYYNKELEIFGRNYIRCCSRCSNDQLFQGRVTDYVKQWSKLDPNKKYYLCGSAEMVVETRDALIAKGVPFANINAEIYF